MAPADDTHSQNTELGARQTRFDGIEAADQENAISTNTTTSKATRARKGGRPRLYSHVTRPAALSVAITPAPSLDRSLHLASLPKLQTRQRPPACNGCAKSKLRCDKGTPCQRCVKQKRECFYGVTQSTREGRIPGSAFDRSGHQKRAILPKESTEAISLLLDRPETLASSGRLVTTSGGARYIGNSVFKSMDIEDEEMDEENDDENWKLDPLSGALMGSLDAPKQSLVHYHPIYAHAMVLWQTYVDNVEPICKLLHSPSTLYMVNLAFCHPAALASKAYECLLFAIYHFAVFAMTEQGCLDAFGQPRHVLLDKYHLATRQALVNASFLKTTNMSVLQALVLFLIPCRSHYDAHTYWILTGVAFRIAQRMGIHRDGEKLGLAPFEVQMRRRMFYQLLPLDGHASIMVGTSLPFLPDEWDTKPPLNINDDQIWPGMAESPQEAPGATDMIFCLSRACMGKFFAQVGRATNGAGPLQFTSRDEAERVIQRADREMQDKFTSYCNPSDPLQYLTICLARSGIVAMRLRIDLPKIRSRTASNAEWLALFHLARQIMDLDAAVFEREGQARFRWHMAPFFLWGNWESLIMVLTALWKRKDLFYRDEIERAWKCIDQAYQNHEHLLTSRRALHVALASLTLKAWDAHYRSEPGGEAKSSQEYIPVPPAYISTLRRKRGVRRANRTVSQETYASSVNPGMADVRNEMDQDHVQMIDSSIDTDDWILWEKLMEDHGEM
ncbi:putative C6 transcription factor [Podospora didyma]|uniref:C6 transcription factor n=1 Tax=Podospora didyma TaxID=330526 RepID=A0AAE0K236_9PEZI|nr:putative C6 transcription factor [Podospora didyma]